MPKLAKVLGQVEKALDMSRKARMTRAEEQGFNTKIPVYHGSADKIREFDAGWSGMTTGNNPNDGFFFTDERAVARDYSRQAFNRRYQDNPEQLVEDGIIESLPDFSSYDEQYEFVEDLANKQLKTHKSYLNIKNPYIKDWEGERIDLELADAIGAFVKSGYDETGLLDDIYDLLEYDKDIIADNIDDIKSFAVDEYGLEDISELEDWQIDEASIVWMDENGFKPELPEYDAILHKNVIDDIGEESAIPHDQYVIFDPDKARSIRASFDPENIGKADMLGKARLKPLAGMAATGTAAAAAPIAYNQAQSIDRNQGIDEQRQASGTQFMERARNPEAYPFIQNEDGSISTHRMAAERDLNGDWYAFPTIVQMPDGSLKQFDDNFEAMRYNKSIGNVASFGADKDAALEFSQGGYKPEELKKFGRDQQFEQQRQASYAKQKQFFDNFSARRLARKAAKTAIGTGEAALTIGSGLANESAAGLAGLYGAATGQNPADIIQHFQENPSLYLPQTEEGMAQLEGLQGLIDDTVKYWGPRGGTQAIQNFKQSQDYLNTQGAKIDPRLGAGMATALGLLPEVL